MRKSIGLSGLLLLIAMGLVWFFVWPRFDANSNSQNQAPQSIPTPVEVAPIETGGIDRIRTFSGTLQPIAQTDVAAKVSGRLEQISVDLADPVSQGQVVARLDNEEYRQAVRQAQADLAVAEANLSEAKSLFTIAERTYNRLQKLRQRNLSTETELDAAIADRLAKQAHVEVTKAQRIRARSLLETARIQLGYTRVVASWRGDEPQRVVAQRYVDQGDTVAANEPLLQVVQLNPIKVVIHATELDYPALHVDQPASLSTDAYPGRRFEARIVRISPVFQEKSRQAQVELWVDNAKLALKPGMFARVQVILERAPSATLVPQQALITREDQLGVFLVTDDGQSVRWQPVEVGIRQGQRVQLLGNPLVGQVVTLGQQLLDDGSSIRIAEDGNGSPP